MRIIASIDVATSSKKARYSEYQHPVNDQTGVMQFGNIRAIKRWSYCIRLFSVSCTGPTPQKRNKATLA
jgi:hypothetical protein